ncbi:MAG: penicillin-binding protein activator [Desulfuromonadales bacterium]
MRCALAGLLILLLGVVAGAETPPPGDHPAAANHLERTFDLLDQVDPQTLPADQRRTLYLALADALLDDGQQERALGFLAQAGPIIPPPTTPDADEAILTRLQKIASPVLAAALQAGTPLAPLLFAELARRGDPLPPAAQARAIGVLLPLSGRFTPLGQEVQRGLELARASHPAAAGSVRFVYRDTANDSAAAPVMAELTTQPGLLAVIGPLISSEAAPAAAWAEQERVPLLLLAPREGITGRHVFRFALTADAQARALADFAGQDLGLKSFAIFHPANRNGEHFSGLFQAAVEQQGGQVVARTSYPPGAVDLRQSLQALAAAAARRGAPEALFIPDEARQVAQILPQLAFARLDQLQLLGTSAWNDPALVRMAGPSSEGAVFVDGFFIDSPWSEVRDFVARFQATYGAPPSILAAQGYDAGRLLLTLLARPEVRDRESLHQALTGLRDFPGVTGRTRFSPSGEAEKSLFLLQVQDGTVVQIN